MGDNSYSQMTLSRFPKADSEAMSRPSTKLVSKHPLCTVELDLTWFKQSRWHQAGAQVAHERLPALFSILELNYLQMLTSRPTIVQTPQEMTMRHLVPTPLKWLK